MTRRPAPIAHLSPDGRAQLLDDHLEIIRVGTICTTPSSYRKGLCYKN